MTSDMTGPIFKIEVAKSNGRFYYTGILKDAEDGWVEIHTTRGEILRFRREQINGQAVVEDTKRDETTRKGIKDLPVRSGGRRSR